jgi:hypothetical protein
MDLLHGTAGCQVAEVDRGEARVLEERYGHRFRVVVVSGDEDHTDVKLWARQTKRNDP